jgi:hypothetical protein
MLLTALDHKPDQNSDAPRSIPLGQAHTTQPFNQVIQIVVLRQIYARSRSGLWFGR